jgi:hypothetical protein
MTLPASISKLGYQTPQQLVTKLKRLLLGMDGARDSGKSEFALSAPGPLAWLCLDRGMDGVLDNPNPPKTRGTNFAIKVVQVPLATQMSQPQYVEYWRAFYNEYKAILDNPDVRTLFLDGDSDSWELQRLAEFGRLSKVPPNLYDNVNAARRAMYARAHDSGKIIIASNRIRKVYVDKTNPITGAIETNAQGNAVRVWNGDYERQGFGDQDYLFGIQLRNMKRDGKNGPEWGIQIRECKADSSLKGMELWGEDCNFASLVQAVYPHIPLKQWGF